MKRVVKARERETDKHNDGSREGKKIIPLQKTVREREREKVEIMHPRIVIEMVRRST